MGTAHADDIDSLSGWLVVAIGFTVLVLVWGSIFTFTVYANELAATFELSSLQVSSVFSVTTAAFYIAGGTAGIIISQMPLRPVIAVTGIAVGVAVGLLQFASTYVELAVAFGLLGMAGGTAFVVTLSLVPLWFDAYEGRAMGVTTTGNGLGILALPFVWVWLLGWLDIRGAFAVVGGATAAVLLLASPIYRRPTSVRPAASTVVDFEWLRTRVSTNRFLVSLVGFPLIWSWYFVLSSSLVDILTTVGVARTVAATAFGIIGGISIVVRVASGAAGDFIGTRTTLLVGVTLAALGVFTLIVANTRPLMYLAVVVFGIALGAIGALYPAILVDRFGPENATAVVGVFTITEATMAFGAPIGLNFLVQLTGGYVIPLVVLGAVTLVGAGLFHWGTAPVPTG